VDALNDEGIAISKSKVLMLGIAYKKNVDDMRESPAVEIMEILRDKGCDIAYSDPHVPVFPEMRRYDFDLESVDLNENALKKYDAVIISTDHDRFDYDLINEHAKLIIDCRGRFRTASARVIRA